MIYHIFDGNSLFARAYYASQRNALDGMEGILSSPQEVGIKMVINILDPYGDKIGKKTDGLLFCWDTKAKAPKERDEKPKDYESTLAQFVQVLKDLFGGTHCRPPEHEADDAVGTAVYRFEEGNEIYVISGDKDLQQLQSDTVHIYDLNYSQVLSREQILTRWHVKRPCQICLALAILGDPGDNIRGIRGWGPKKVEKLFELVSPEMGLREAYETLKAQMDPEKQAVFDECLNLTILDPNVPGVNEPLPVTFASNELVRALGYQSVLGRYMKLRDAYSGVVFSPEEVADSIVDAIF